MNKETKELKEARQKVLELIAENDTLMNKLMELRGVVNENKQLKIALKEEHRKFIACRQVLDEFDKCADITYELDSEGHRDYEVRCVLDDSCSLDGNTSHLEKYVDNLYNDRCTEKLLEGILDGKHD